MLNLNLAKPYWNPAEGRHCVQRPQFPALRVRWVAIVCGFFSLSLAQAQVSAPQFQPPDGSALARSFSVVVTGSTSGSVIHYTTNGVVPTVNDPVVSSGSSVSIGYNLTLKARAWDSSGANPSSVTSAQYWVTGWVGAGGRQALAIKSNGQALAWGDQNNGQLGNGQIGAASITSPAPVLKTGGASFLNAVSGEGGIGHTLLIDDSGGVWAMGANGSGQLGDGTTTAGAYAKQVFVGGTTTYLNNIVGVAAGDSFSLAVSSIPAGSGTDGKVWAWGSEADGRLGNGSTGATKTWAVPVTVTGGTNQLMNIVQVAAGKNFGLALGGSGTGTGTVWSWGDNSSGQLGIGTTTGTSRAVQVMSGSTTPLTGVESIAAGDKFSIALLSSGTVVCWGEQANGHLGNGEAGGVSISIVYPTQGVKTGPSAYLSNIIQVAAGSTFGMALDVNQNVWAWGETGSGQLGAGISGDSGYARKVVTSGTTGVAGATYLDHVVFIAAGGGAGTTGFGIAIRNDGTIYEWGRNNSGQLGNGNTSDSNTAVVAGGTTTLTNTPPSVTMSVDTNHLLAPADVYLSATASDSDGSIDRVQFYNGTGLLTLLNTDLDAPYNYVWQNVASGTYTFSAVAYDDVGASTTGTTQTVSVVKPQLSIQAQQSTIAENSPAGTMRISVLNGTVSHPLNVSYTLGGSATSGVDYQALSGVVTINAESNFGDIRLQPIPNAGLTGSKTISVTLAAASAYTIGTGSSAQMTLTGSSSLAALSGQTLGDWTDNDVGPVGAAGAAGVSSGSAAVYIIQGAGSGFSGTADSFNFLNQKTGGDVEITARVSALDNVDPYTQAGVSVRESLNEDAINATLSVSAQDGVNLTIRDATGDTTIKDLGVSTQGAPVWLRLVKVGETVAGYTSTDGASWTLVVEDVLEKLPKNYYAGMVVTSAVSGTLAQAQFSRVSLASNFPGGMSGLVLWLRADQGIGQSSGTTNGWFDMSGYANNATQADTAKQPQWVDNVMNEHPVLRFNGTTGLLSVADNPSLNPAQVTMALVGSTQTTSGSRVFLTKSHPNWGDGYGLLRSGSNAYGFVNGISHQQGAIFPANTGGLLLAKYDIQNFVTSINGTGASTSYTSALNNNSNFLYLGGDNNPSHCNQGDIAEAMVFNRALTDQEVGDIQAYAYQKYRVGTQPTLAKPAETGTSPLPSIYASPQTIALNDIAGATIYYTADGSEPAESSLVYSNSLSINSTGTWKFKAFKPGFLPSATLSLEYTILYGGAHVITLDAVPGKTIYYTIDGSEPTQSSLVYSGPITINSTTTLKYRAFDSEGAAGGTVTQVFTIDNSSSAIPHDGLALWLRADRGVNQSSGTTAWVDISGNNFSAQSSGTNQPALVTGTATTGLNGRPVVRFNGTNSYLSVADSAALKPSTLSIFAVANCQTASGNKVFLAKSSTSLSSGYGLYSNSGTAYGFINGTSSSQKAGGTFPVNTYGVLSTIYDLNQIRTSITGTVSTLAYTNAISNVSTPLYLGASGTSSLQNPCDLAEVLVYNRALSNSERMDVEAYLYGRYQIGNSSPKLPAPTADQFSVVPGLIVSGTSGTATGTLSVPAGVIARYSTGTSDPSSGTVYDGTTPIALSGTTVLNIKYFKPNYIPSDTFTATYTVDPSLEFDPSGLKLWLRADKGVSTVSGTMQWADQSTFGNSAIQQTSANQPLWISGTATTGLNGRPVFQFDGTNDFLSVADSAVLNPSKVSIFAVASYQTTSNSRIFLAKSNSGLTNGYGLYGNTNNTNTYGFINNAGQSSNRAGGAFVTGTYGILSTIYDTQQIRTSVTSGTAQTNVYTTNYTTAITSGTSPLYLGSHNGTNYKNSCNIAEVLVFDRALSQQQRVTVEGYLYGRYHIGSAPQLPDPTLANLSVPPGAYDNVQHLDITVPYGQTAHYTTDGTVPALSSPVYTPGEPISINSTMVFKLAFFRDGFIASNGLTVSYTIGFGEGAPPTSGLMLWLRSDLGITTTSGTLSNNATVSAWADQSGRNNNAGAAGIGQPTLVTTGSATINGIPAIHFDGKKNYMGIADNANLKPTYPAVYVVGRYYPTAQTINRPFLLKTSNSFWNDGYGIFQQKGNINAFINSVTGNKLGAGFAPNVPGYFGLTYSGSTFGASLTGANYTRPYTRALINVENAPLLLGGDTIKNFLQCDIAEVLLYDHVLSTGELQNLQSYFYLRYFIGALPQLAAPTAGNLSLAPGDYTTPQGVFITVPAGQQAYYTTDGITDPTTNSTLYDGNVIPIDQTTKLKVRFFKTGYAPSDTLTVPYTIGSEPSFPKYGLQLWLKADAGVTLSGTTGPATVGAWTDQSESGNNNNAAQVTTSKQPLLATGTFSGTVRPVIRFDGSDDCLAVANNASVNPSQLTAFVVASTQAATGNKVAFLVKSNSSWGNGYGVYQENGTAYGYVNGTNHKVGSTFSGSTYGLLWSKYDAQTLVASVSGTENSLSYAAAVNNDPAPLYLGSYNGNNANPCDIAEAILFNRVLSDSEMAEMKAYFYGRYGIGPLPSVPAPHLPVSQIFSGTFTVTMKGTSWGSIHYTTDGTTTPTESSPTYDSAHPLQISETTTVKAKGFVSGWAAGDVTTVTYTKDSPIPEGPALRLRADVGVATTGTANRVTSWTDQGGSGLVASASGTSSQPLLVTGTTGPNSRPMIHFSGTRRDYLTIPDDPTLKPLTISVYLVGRQTGSGSATGGNKSLFFKKTNDNYFNNGYGFVRQGSGDDFGFFINNESNNKATGTIVSGTTNAQFFTAQLGYDNYRISFLENGIPQTSKLSYATINNSAQPLHIGGDGNQTYSLDGDIVELIIYNRSLTAGEQTQLQNYFSTKYSISTPVQTPGNQPGIPDGSVPPAGYTDSNPSVAPTITITYPGNATLLPP